MKRENPRDMYKSYPPSDWDYSGGEVPPGWEVVDKSKRIYYPNLPREGEWAVGGFPGMIIRRIKVELTNE